MTPRDSKWLVCQLGAREHYVLPAAFSKRGRLAALVTDAWVPPGNWIRRLPGEAARRLGDRWHPDIERDRVLHFTPASLRFETLTRLRGDMGWVRTIRRNDWFQDRVAALLKRRLLLTERPIVLAYSYAARGIFMVAKAAGCSTVLCQIDPGPKEEELVCEAAEKSREFAGRYERAPANYWDYWRQECRLADHIVVNSAWSRQALLADGIASEKVSAVPLSYESGPPVAPRNYASFSEREPLKVLFVGTCGIRKGLVAMLNASLLLRDRPIEFWLVGEVEGDIPRNVLSNPKLHLTGAVPRSLVKKYYEQADIFLFPTLSDGFGIVQLEAQAAGLPLIASRSCGEVVVDGVNGWLLEEPSAHCIAERLLWCLEHPLELSAASAASLSMTGRYSADVVSDRLLSLPVT